MIYLSNLLLCFPFVYIFKIVKTTALVEKGNALRIPKIYRNLSLLFSFFEIFLIFLKTFFKPKFQKITKTANLNVRVLRPFSTCEAQIL